MEPTSLFLIRVRKSPNFKAHLKLIEPRENLKELTIMAKDHLEIQNIFDT